jgi:formylglycine-generating enzyme required for sulfatase activity
VGWDDVQDFLNKLNDMTGRNYRLPTEAEWAHAANAGTKYDTYKYAGSKKIQEVAWFKKNSDGRHHPVGTKLPNSIGIYDMSGNVWEWCQDYQKNESDSVRACRGGSWSYGAEYCTVSTNFYIAPHSRGYELGFRVILP